VICQGDLAALTLHWYRITQNQSRTDRSLSKSQAARYMHHIKLCLRSWPLSAGACSKVEWGGYCS